LLLGLALGTGCGAVITPPPPSPTATMARPVADNGPAVVSTKDLAAVPLTPVPPTPTFTPTPSPTPVIHVVASGDTLFGIAIEYGVPSQAIQEANGLENPNALSIGQSLIIPLGEEEAAEQTASGLQDHLLLPTPTPVPLTVQGVALYPTTVGGTWCMGEVYNTTESPVTNLQVKITLVDANGAPVVSRSVLAAADYLPPGRAAPFAVRFKEIAPDTVEARVELLRAENVSAITASFMPLTARVTTSAFVGPQYSVSGEVRNDSGHSLKRVAVVVTLYDEGGKVVAYRQTEVEADVAPGEQTPFSLLLTPRGEAAADLVTFQVLTWGHATD